MTTTTQNTLQTVTYEEDKKVLNEVIDEITIQKNEVDLNCIPPKKYVKG